MILGIKTIRAQEKLLGGVKSFLLGTIKSECFADILYDVSAMLLGFCYSKSYEERLANFIDDISGQIKEEIYLYWYDEGLENCDDKPALPQKIEDEIRQLILPYVNKIEKLIIRGTTEGPTVTEEEKSEWWKRQKEREREEFYNRYGYYEEE